MKNAITILACLLLVLSVTNAPAQERLKKKKTDQTVITKQPVQPAQPKRMKVPPHFSRAATTPDVNQHMTWRQFIDQLPANPPSIRNKYRPPKEFDLDWKVFEKNFCAPAAVANNLMWLDANYFPQISDHTNALGGGVFLARELSGDDYFSTMNKPGVFEKDGKLVKEPKWHLSEGTGTMFVDMINGTVKFLKEKQIPVKEVRWISLWAAPEAKSELILGSTPLVMKRRAPKLSEVKNAIKSRSIIVQIFGHYELKDGHTNTLGLAPNKEDKPAVLVRTGGHYFAPVGYGLDKDGKISANTFAYHDSASDKQDQQTQHFHTWLAPTGAYKDVELRKFREEGVKYPSRACKNEEEGWECLGYLRDTYVRNKQAEDHSAVQRIRVLEGMMVIRL